MNSPDTERLKFIERKNITEKIFFSCCYLPLSLPLHSCRVALLSFCKFSNTFSFCGSN